MSQWEEEYSPKFFNSAKRKAQGIMFNNVLHSLIVHRKLKAMEVLCLPGIAGWDINFFNSRRVKANIIALERSEPIFNTLKNKYPDVKVLNTTSSEFLNSTNKKFNVIYLDYFCPFNEQIRLDLELIFRRNLLFDGGKVCFTFYSKRESITTTIKNRLYTEDFCKVFNEKVPTNTEQLRILNINAFIFMFLRNVLKQGVKAAQLNKYETSAGFMYNCWLHYTKPLSYGRNSDGLLKTKKSTRDLWLRQGEYKHVTQITSSERDFRFLGSAAYDHISVDKLRKQEILAFYTKNKYTPSKTDLKYNCVSNYNDLVRSLNLCPRSYATNKELLTELSRIYKREGVVTVKALKIAKVRHRIFLRGIKLMDVPEFKAGKDLILINRKISRVKQYLKHLTKGGLMCDFEYYCYIYAHKLQTRTNCINFLTSQGVL